MRHSLILSGLLALLAGCGKPEASLPDSPAGHYEGTQLEKIAGEWPQEGSNGPLPFKPVRRVEIDLYADHTFRYAWTTLGTARPDRGSIRGTWAGYEAAGKEARVPEPGIPDSPSFGPNFPSVPGERAGTLVVSASRLTLTSPEGGEAHVLILQGGFGRMTGGWLFPTVDLRTGRFADGLVNARWISSPLVDEEASPAGAPTK
jgi:hypothetical protein